MKQLTAFLTTLLLLTLTINAVAQKPSAILVMLKSERSKINHFITAGEMANVELVKQEREKVIDVTMLDFTTHFDYCPVYYFMDTSLPQVLEKNLGGILFNEKKEIYESTPLTNGSSSFLIVYYGIPKDEIKTNNKNEHSYQAISYPADGMVILDHTFKRRPKGEHYLYEPDLYFYVSKSFGYTSKSFAMEYKPYAGTLQKYLSKSRSTRVIE